MALENVDPKYFEEAKEKRSEERLQQRRYYVEKKLAKPLGLKTVKKDGILVFHSFDD